MAVSLLASCVGGQTGDDGVTKCGTDRVECLEVGGEPFEFTEESPPLDPSSGYVAINPETNLPYSVVYAAEYDCRVQWAPDPRARAGQVPSEGVTTAHLRLEATKLSDPTPPDALEGTNQEGQVVFLSPRLFALFTTADGALAESFMTRLDAREHWAELNAVLDLAALRGSFQVDTVQFPRAVLRMQFSGGRHGVGSLEDDAAVDAAPERVHPVFAVWECKAR